MAAKKQVSKNEVSRQWCCVGYPGDSLPENYAQILDEEYHLCWAESPVHDADFNADETQKKKHIHFIFKFEGNKSFDQIKEITDRLNAPIPQKVKNPVSMIRYFIHYDNPEKFQYREIDIKCHGGYDYGEAFSKGAVQYRVTLKEVLAFCRDNAIHEFCDLLDAVLLMDSADDWFDVITCRNTLAINAYLRSSHHKKKEAREELEREMNRRF